MDGGRVGFRPPLTSVLPLTAFLSALALVLPSGSGWLLVVLGTVVFGSLRLRQLLVLDKDHLEVTVFRTRRVPWSEIRGFEAGTGMRGGTLIDTSDGPVHSIAPCSWWGGPAVPADLESLRRELARRSRRR